MFSTTLPSFLHQLHLETTLPKGVEVMNPYRDREVFKLCELFYKKYYDDKEPRTLMLGINPGRFGSGATGISFTDPIRLEKECGIENHLPKKPELSSEFIYMMINAYGGPERFYKKFFISAVSPLGFTLHGKNINYYDDKKLEKAVRPFIIDSINKMMKLGINREKCFCIGEGKNQKFLETLNKEHRWWGEIVPLAHPRFVMQYRRKKVEEYIADYLDKFG